MACMEAGLSPFLTGFHARSAPFIPDGRTHIGLIGGPRRDCEAHELTGTGKVEADEVDKAMLLILISLAWLSVVVLVVAMCRTAAHSEGDRETILARRLEPDPALMPVVIRDRGDQADAALGARGHFPSGVLAPPAGAA
jgi:hypothetical protein